MLKIIQNVCKSGQTANRFSTSLLDNLIRNTKCGVRWKNTKVLAPYKAAILEDFNKELTIENITNRTNLGDGMIRVGVTYCSLNMVDVWYMTKENDEVLLPMIPGSEFSGEVMETGDRCQQNFKTGDKIVSLLAYRHLGGGLADECVVNENECFDVGSVSLKNAAVLVNSHGTALLAFTKYCQLNENDIVIIIAGPAGNGLAAIQLASSVFKAKVYAISDTEATSALLRDEGAYKSISVNEGLGQVYKFLDKSLKGQKAKLVYDAVGGGLLYVTADFIDPEAGCFLTADPFYSPESFPSTKPEFKKPTKKTSGDEADAQKSNEDAFIPKIQKVDLSDCRIKDLDLYRQVIQDALSLCEEEIVCPYISKKFGLYDINEAVEFVKSKKCTGKVLIDLTVEPKQSDTAKTQENESNDANSDSDEKEKKK